MPEHIKKRDKNIFISIFIPNKNDEREILARKFSVLFCAAAIIICGILALCFDNKTTQASDENGAKVKVEPHFYGSLSLLSEKTDEPEKPEPKMLDKFKELYSQNEDLIGHIKVGHRIDYPVFMNKDDTDYYLYRNSKKEYSISGSIFIDNHIQPFSQANNLVAYGHNMMSGEFFSTLNYYNPFSSHKAGVVDYYKKYPTFSFDTLYEEGVYKIFAGMYTDAEDEKEANGYPYPYHRKRQFKNEYEFMDFMGNIMDRSSFYTDVDVQYGDQIMTLSTCFWLPFSKEQLEGRFVIFARKLRNGESPDVDVSKFVINKNPLMFPLYNKTLGDPWRGRNWDLSLVKDFDKYTDKIDSLDEKEPEDNRPKQ